MYDVRLWWIRAHKRNKNEINLQLKPITNNPLILSSCMRMLFHFLVEVQGRMTLKSE